LDTKFIGENLLPGQLGHFFILLSFVSSLLSLYAYWQASKHEISAPQLSNTWLKVGKNSFIIHTAGIIATFGALYYIITNHLFEYHYAWAHSDKSLNMRYLLSCFWEGQQGSFLLWAFWHSILGTYIVLKGSALESRVMVIVSLIQILLSTTVLGFHLPGNIQIGTSPFILLRDQMQNAPIFQQANYLASIQDGNGLNVLLQNYWMVIHPPILFLGFASTLIPFAYTVAALWKGDYKEWIKPTINWSLFSGGALSLGIMMGGAWAYESLNFGGYWAWDPVENASLVPWMLMVAALHTLVIFKSTGRSLMITCIFFVFSYIGIWYSTFLTRTGVLGDTSVHAFTGEGKSLYWQLLFFIGTIAVLGFGWIIARRKSMPLIKTEEDIWTREFWMFIGSFILFLAALQISISTSIPVWAPLAKWISGKDIAPPVDPVAHYNNIQIWVAIFITFVSAATFFLKYKKTNLNQYGKAMLKLTLISIALTLLIGYTQKITGWQFILLLFCTSFSLVGNFYYALFHQKGITKMGGSITHLGFGILILGVIITGLKKEVISLNTLGGILPIGKEDIQEAFKESQENVMLYKDMPVAMSDYNATYIGDSTHVNDPRTFYNVLFERKDTVKNITTERFILSPNAFVNPKGAEGLSANPSSKHYWNKDIFTYVNSVSGKLIESDTTNEFRGFEIKKGDTIYLSKAYMIFQGFNTQIQNKQYQAEPGDVAVEALIDIYNIEGKINSVAPLFFIRNSQPNYIDDTTTASVGAVLRLANIIPEIGKAEIQVKEVEQTKPWIVLKAIVFPHINLVWLGTIIMVLGFWLSMKKKSTQKI
jgi:cytochrome c-type biogenesis protein CcmF